MCKTITLNPEFFSLKPKSINYSLLNYVERHPLIQYKLMRSYQTLFLRPDNQAAAESSLLAAGKRGLANLFLVCYCLTCGVVTGAKHSSATAHLSLTAFLSTDIHWCFKGI